MDDRQPGRDLYWRDRDGSTYRCPGCGRPRDAVDGIELHHRDRRRNNNDPNNLIGLCRDCHQEGEHGNRQTSTRLEAPSPFGVDEPTPSIGGPP